MTWQTLELRLWLHTQPFLIVARMSSGSTRTTYCTILSSSSGDGGILSDVSFHVDIGFGGKKIWHTFTLYCDDRTYFSTCVADWITYVLGIRTNRLGLLDKPFNDEKSPHICQMTRVDLYPSPSVGSRFMLCAFFMCAHLDGSPGDTSNTMFVSVTAGNRSWTELLDWISVRWKNCQQFLSGWVFKGGIPWMYSTI